MAPLLYPPHSIAFACVYISALVLFFETAASPEHSNSECRISCRVVELPGKSGSWDARFHFRPEDLRGLPAPALTANLFGSQEIAHTVMDLLLREATTSAFQSSSPHSSPSIPQSPSPYSHPPLVSATRPAMVAPSIPHRPGPDRIGSCGSRS